MSFKFNWNPELKFGASQVLQSSKTKFILIWEFKTILKPFLQ